MPDIMAPCHLFRLLHQRKGARQLAFAVQHFTVYRRGNDPAVEVGQRQFIQCDHRQAFGFIRVAVVNRHLGPQGVKFTVQGVSMLLSISCSARASRVFTSL